jgi:5-methylcytosine-specific restriction endonuclease McrA
MTSRPCLGCNRLIPRGSYCTSCLPSGFYTRPSPSRLDRPSPHLSAKIRKRDGYACVECGGTRDLEVHHVLGVADGGGHDERNLVTPCRDCHRAVT